MPHGHSHPLLWCCPVVTTHEEEQLSEDLGEKEGDDRHTGLSED